MPKNQIFIIGGGISGLSCGWKLVQQGKSVTLFEASSQIGGLAATFRYKDYCLDIGPHSFFTEDTEIRQVVLDLFDHSLLPLKRDVKFFFRGKYLDYPFTPAAVLTQMGLDYGIQAALSFMIAKIGNAMRFSSPQSSEDQTVEAWALSHFGRHLYESFFKPYTEQFWGISCKELSARAIPSHTRLSFLNTLRLLVQKKISPDGGSLIEREKLEMYYPPSGYGEISEKILSAFIKLGGNLRMRCQITGIEKIGDHFLITVNENGESKTHEADTIVSTIPLSALIKMLKPMASEEVLNSADKLDYRPILVLGVITSKQDVLDCGYMYVLNKPYNRITEMNKFSKKTSPNDENIISLEIPCNLNSWQWTADKKELLAYCLPSLEQDKLLQHTEIKDLMLIKNRYAYPIYRFGYAAHLDKCLRFIQAIPNLYTLGRLGEFMYMDADKCMRRAFDLAEQIKLNANQYAYR